MSESESDYEESSEEEFNEFDALLKSPPQEDDSDDDSEFPIDFDSVDAFEPNEFEPDITPMSYFLKGGTGKMHFSKNLWCCFNQR